MAGCYEQGGESFGSVKGVDLFDQLSHWWLIKKNSAPLDWVSFPGLR